MLGDRFKSRLQCYFHSGFSNLPRSMQASWVAIRSELGLLLSLESWVDLCETCGANVLFIQNDVGWFLWTPQKCILWIFGWISRFSISFTFQSLDCLDLCVGPVGPFFRRGTNWTWRTMTTRFRMMTMRLAPSHLEKGLMIDRKEGKEISERLWKVNQKTIQKFSATEISDSRIADTFRILHVIFQGFKQQW